MRNKLFGLFLLAPLLSGCAVLGIGVASVIVSQDVLDNSVYVAQLNTDAARLWASAKVTLNHASLKPIDTDEDLRKATADVDGAKVTVGVETYDLNKSVLRVSAKKFGVNNGEIARMVYDKILSDLEHD